MGLNPSCNRAGAESKRQALPVLGDPPFKKASRDIAVAELKAVGVPLIILTEKEVEVFKEGSEADRLGRVGCYVPEIAKRSETEIISVYKVAGEYGKFTFYRAWYYWIVKGPMPLEAAVEMFADPAGVTDVRVTGHCGCPPPEKPWITWRLPDGRGVLPLNQKEECEKHANCTESAVLKDIGEKLLKENEFSDDPASLGALGFIDSYHIDTFDGLKLYVDTLRRYNLV